ncbi:MAG: AsmA family protein [Flavobacteriaceae bacterium]|nr:AsmA family protein [Flavobacteriaceae bacterium]
MKKKLKILGLSLLFIVTLLLVLPFAFKGKIIELIKQTANNNINATIHFEDADLSFLRAFPLVKLQLNNFYITNKEPFDGDTLVKAEKIDLELPLKSIFNKASEAIPINSFYVNNANLQIKIDTLGNANYDIIKKDSAKISTSENTSDSFSFNLKDYVIKNSTLSYNDLRNKAIFRVADLNHSGEGNLSAEESILKTKSDALASFSYDGISYLKNHRLALLADVNINLRENKYTFLDNSAKINDLPLVFNGFVQVNDDYQELDITFETPSSDFKNFLALLPKEYSKNIKGVTTTGNFNVRGTLKGIIDDTRIPKFNISIHSEDASFKYPDLPKSLNKIQINTKVVNETGLSKDTYIDIDKLSFRIDDEVFNANAQLKNLTKNMRVNARVNGGLDLAKLEQIYPADGFKNLQGMFRADISSDFDMRSIEQQRYQDTKTSGQASLSNFEYSLKEWRDTLRIDYTSLDFTPTVVSLKGFDATIGQTDLRVTGTLKNLLGFLFNKQNLEGNFVLNSTQFVINDFMAAEANTNSLDTLKSDKKQLNIPSFLDASIKATAGSVVYDNLTLKNVSGDLHIKDQTASLKNMRSTIFGGQLGFDGLVSTKSETPTFNMKLDADNFDIGQSFSSVDLFKALAPIASVIQGKINTNIVLSGDLATDLTPNLSSISGDVLAQLFSSKISAENSLLLQKLTNNLTFFDPKKLILDDLKASLTFKDGRVAVKPFILNYEDIEIAVGGNHGFDKSIDYDAVFNVPAKYLGKEAEKLLAQLSVEEQNAIRVPVTAMINGRFSDPSISTDLKSAVTALTKQIANNQKDKLVEKGKDKLDDALDRLLNKNRDSTKIDTSKMKTDDAIKETAKELLNGLFRKKKKDTSSIKKDTVE